MGNQKTAATPSGDPLAIYEAYRAHNSGQRKNTDIVIQTTLLAQYPSHSLASVTCDLIKYAEAGHATATLAGDVHPTLRSLDFRPPARRNLDVSSVGTLEETIVFGRYDYLWQDHRFQVFVVRGIYDTRYYVLSQPSNKEGEGRNDSATAELVRAASMWFDEINEEVWVYDDGHWRKDRELWRVVHGARWEDVILDEGMKTSIMRDVTGFFDAKDTYAEFGTPWKRGVLCHGSPGNGKSTTAKALMGALMARANPIPTLYVKTLAQRGWPPEMSIRQIFTKARQTAPCLLLLEDVDSLVTDEVRSYFLNEIDGLEDNDGILIFGSTNNLEKLDPALSKRPSRFDRKYRFVNPSFQERLRYCEYWRKKLSGKSATTTPATLSEHIASMTEGFSFAYLKEAFIASLLTLGRAVAEGAAAVEEDDDRKWGRLGNLLQKQVAALREEMAEAEAEAK